MGEEFLRPLDHFRRHARQPGYMHAPALVGGARRHLMEKHQRVAVLLHQHLHVGHPRQPVHRRQLEIVGRKERAAADSPMEMLHHCLRDRQPVERARAPAHLIENHQAPRRGPVENAGCLRHLHQKCARPSGQVIAGADAGKQPIDDPHPRPPGRHEAAGLCHHGHQRRLANERALASHIGPRHQQHRRGLRSIGRVGEPGRERQIVGHQRAGGQQFLEHRMAACLNSEFTVERNLRPHPAAAGGD